MVFVALAIVALVICLQWLALRWDRSAKTLLGSCALLACSVVMIAGTLLEFGGQFVPATYERQTIQGTAFLIHVGVSAAEFVICLIPFLLPRESAAKFRMVWSAGLAAVAIYVAAFLYLLTAPSI